MRAWLATGIDLPGRANAPIFRSATIFSRRSLCARRNSQFDDREKEERTKETSGAVKPNTTINHATNYASGVSFWPLPNEATGT